MELFPLLFFKTMSQFSHVNDTVLLLYLSGSQKKSWNPQTQIVT